MKNNNTLSIVLAGEAGQGIQTTETLAAEMLKQSGYHVFATKEYMSRVRGGVNSTEIRISSSRITGYSEHIDIMIPLDKKACAHLKNRISENTVILCETSKTCIGCTANATFINVPLGALSAELGGAIYSSILAGGVLLGLFISDKAQVNAFLMKTFSGKDEKIVAANLLAVSKGMDIGFEIRNTGKIDMPVKPEQNIGDNILLNGADAVALGSIAGGCNFISSYPMSPGTGVLTALAGYSDSFGILVEQAEDEIAAINMGLGAWYAGSRAMVTTSGGGYDLMTEGVSLAGMIETPIVIHLAQRPGPATGLPTRTEQADLELSVYAGHGEFPRIVLSPGNIEEAFYLSARAFDLADRFQAPVFILTDQFLMDSYYDVKKADLDPFKIRSSHYFIQTDKDYRRYRFTEDGISPRGVPGYGSGLVLVDSDEHDEEGHITENLEGIRVKMVRKRLKKLETMKPELPAPVLFGDSNYKHLIIGWGSTLSAAAEAVNGKQGIAYLHFGCVHPLPPGILSYLTRAGKVTIIEGNATGQFAKLLMLDTGFRSDNHYLKYNGLPFSVEEIEAIL